MKSFRMNRKAISPIFATLILIAIAVIAGVVVYMFTSGTLSTMTGSGTAGQEKVSVQAVQVNYGAAGATGTNAKWTTTAPSGGTVSSLSIYAQAQGNKVTISNIIIKDAGGNVVTTAKLETVTSPNANTNLVDTTLTAITVSPTTGIPLNFPAGQATYTVTLVGSGGGSFVSPTFSVIA